MAVMAVMAVVGSAEYSTILFCLSTCPVVHLESVIGGWDELDKPGVAEETGSDKR